MSSDLSNLNFAVSTDRSVDYGAYNNPKINKSSSEALDKKPIAPIEVSNPKLLGKETVEATGINKTQTAKAIEEETEAVEEETEAVEKEQLSVANELKEALNDINSALYSYNHSLKFELHEETDNLVVKVLNTKTNEVIRQYPSDEILQHKARLLEGNTNFFTTQVL